MTPRFSITTFPEVAQLAAFEGERADAVAVARHPLGVAAVAAEDQPAEFARVLSAGEVSGAETEIEAGADERDLYVVAVSFRVPFPRVGVERLASPPLTTSRR